MANGTCIDVVPVGESSYVARPYGLDDVFKGALSNENTLYMGIPFMAWMKCRNVSLDDISGDVTDLQSARLFPMTDSIEELGILLRWMTSEPELNEGRELWLKLSKLSADEISAQANLQRLYAQRETFRKKNWEALQRNYSKSVFYQLDLEDAACEMVKMEIDMPQPLSADDPHLLQMHNHMLRSRMMHLKQKDAHLSEGEKAFQWLREGLRGEVCTTGKEPKLNIYADQIVWGRSPVQIGRAHG